MIAPACALLLGMSVADAAPLLRYEFSKAGEVQSSTGSDHLDLTVFASNGIVPEDRVAEVPAASPGTRTRNALDFRYKGERKERGVAVAGLSDYAPLTSQLSSFTVTAWIYGHTIHADGVIRRVFRLANPKQAVIDFRIVRTSQGNGLLSLALNGDEAVLQAPEESGVVIPGEANEWYFVAVSFNATDNVARLYAAPEGAPLASYSNPLPSPIELLQNATTLSIGNAGRGHDRQVDAFLSDVRFYDSALSQDELNALCASSQQQQQASLFNLLLLPGLLIPIVRRRQTLLAGLALAFCAIPARAVEIAGEGKAKAVIVIADDAPAVVSHAAQELAASLKEAVGAEFAIERESGVSTTLANAIYLGNTKALAQTKTEISRLKKNAFLRLSTDRALYLVGGDDPEWQIPADERLGMGTLLAVYDFLDRDLGVRWLWPGEAGTVVPKRKELTIPPAAVKRVEPHFLFNRMAFNRMRQRVGDWENGEEFADRTFQQVHLWMRHQRMVRTLDIETGHGYGKYWSRFGKTHPEFFALRPDGQRAPVDKREYLVQMCVSNPALWKVIVDDWLQNDPQRPWIIGFENDRRVIDPTCICAECRSWDVPEAKVSVPHNPWHIDSRSPEEVDPYESVSLSDRYARFYLELQKEGQKHDPFAKVVGFAYSNYSDPPVKMRLNSNIIISVVPPYIYPFGKGKEGQFRALWDGWRETGATLYYRPNHTLIGYCMPYIYSSQLGKDLKYAMDNGMVGSIFDSLLGMWGVHGPDLYLLGRLHARPEMTPEAILDEYYSAFGPAEKAVRAYFSYWEEISKKCNEAFRAEINGGWAVISHGGHLIYTPSVMEKGAALLREAEAKAGDSPEYAARVHYLSVWLENARLSMQLLRMAKVFQSDAETPEDKTKRLAARDELLKFRREHQQFLMGGNWDKVGPYEPWHKWEE